MWTLLWSVPTWNLRHRSASRYERQASCRKSYRRLSVWGEPGWPWWSINLVATRNGCPKLLLDNGCSGCWQSSRHHKTLSAELLAEAHGLLTKRLLVPERGITNPGQLVSQRTRRLVVVAPGLHIQRPAPNTANLFASTLSPTGRSGTNANFRCPAFPLRK